MRKPKCTECGSKMLLLQMYNKKILGYICKNCNAILMIDTAGYSHLPFKLIQRAYRGLQCVNAYEPDADPAILNEYIG